MVPHREKLPCASAAGHHDRFGESLEPSEQEWLVWEINQKIAEVRGSAPTMADMPPEDAPEVSHCPAETASALALCPVLAGACWQV